jgi:hypothetical protein
VSVQIPSGFFGVRSDPTVSYSQMTGILSTRCGKSSRYASTGRSSLASSRRRLSPSAEPVSVATTAPAGPLLRDQEVSAKIVH